MSLLKNHVLLISLNLLYLAASNYHVVPGDVIQLVLLAKVFFLK